MESRGYSPMDASTRPSLGFPLGTALMLMVIFSLSGIFSCCYHWDKFRSIRQSFSNNNHLLYYNNNLDDDLEANNHSTSCKPLPNPLMEKQVKMRSMGVIMPGNEMPTFIAMPCPCEPPHLLLSTSLPPLFDPPKPPRFPIPLY